MASTTFFCIDAHTCGNPVRVVAGGGPALTGKTMSDYRQDFMARFDWVRHALMFEPRGHDVMSGSVLYKPLRDDCDLGLVFIETSGCLPMCGHGTIGTVTVALEQGLASPREEGKLALDAPAGKVVVEYVRDGRFIEKVRLFNVASFLEATDVAIDVPGLGPLKVDVAYGGNYYAIIDPQPGYGGLETLSADQVLRLSPIVRNLMREKLQPVHPENPTIKGVSHVMWTGKPTRSQGACAQRRLLRRPRHRPLALRHRHLGADGAARRQGQARGGRRLRPREHHRQPLRGPRRGRGPRRQQARDQCPASPAGPASPATTPSSSTTATPTPTGSRWCDACGRHSS